MMVHMVVGVMTTILLMNICYRWGYATGVRDGKVQVLERTSKDIQSIIDRHTDGKEVLLETLQYRTNLENLQGVATNDPEVVRQGSD